MLGFQKECEMLRTTCASILCLFGISSCSSPQPFSTYEYVGIDLGTAVSGSLRVVEGCVVIDAEDEIGTINAVFPEGTSFDGTFALLPAQNGGARVQLGQTYTYEGGLQATKAKRRTSSLCPERSFIINRIRGDL